MIKAITWLNRRKLDQKFGPFTGKKNWPRTGAKAIAFGPRPRNVGRKNGLKIIDFCPPTGEKLNYNGGKAIAFGQISEEKSYQKWCEVVNRRAMETPSPGDFMGQIFLTSPVSK